MLLHRPDVSNPRDFCADSEFWLNDDFAVVKNGKVQPRGRVNLIGRLQVGFAHLVHVCLIWFMVVI